MELLIAGLLVVNLAVTLVSIRLLERKTTGALCDVKKRLDMVNGAILGSNSAIEKLARVVQERNAQPSGEEEARMSRAMEEGLANILGYTAGKGGEAGT